MSVVRLCTWINPRAAVGLLCLLSLGGCVSTEPLSTPPHINLSPENMSFADAQSDSQLDFGLTVTVNESDSLENLEVLPGLRVRSVRSGSAADLAGIRSGDVLLALNDVETNQADALAAIARSSQREEFDVKARRGTTVYETTLARPKQRQSSTPQALYRVDPVRTRAGYSTELANVAGGEQRTVARIAELFPHSPLIAAGLQKGDVIVTLDGEGIQSAQALVNALHQRPLGSRVNLAVIAQSESELSNSEPSNSEPSNPEARTQEFAIDLWEPERRLSSLALWPLFRYESSLAPEQVEFSILDLVLFSLFSYERQEGEKTYSFLGLFEFGSGYGELVDESPTADAAR